MGHTTRNTYDADNRLIQETYADTPADTRTYTYDATGHRASRLDQNGQTTTYQYNDFYYLTNRSYSAGPADRFTYDLGGRVLGATRSGWTDTFTYDGASRVLTAVQNGQTVAYIYVIPSGIRTIAYPSGLVITEDYDLRSRLMTVNDGGSPVVTLYTYDLDNNVLSRSNRNGTVATYSYNADSWVTNLTHSNTSGLIAGFAYAYDDEGNKAYQKNEAVLSKSETYTYDALYRLTNFDVGTLSGGVIPLPSLAESYNLDAVGNWTSFVSNAVTQTRTDNAVNEIQSIGTNTLTYDANGNLLDDGHYTYTYDGENRLTTVTRDSDSALVGQYTYDARGSRVISIVNPAGTPETNVYIYDGSRMLEEQSPGGSAEADYTYGNYLDEVVTMNRGGLTYYYHPNSLYNVEAITDSTGAPVERYTYDAYGEPTITDGSYNPIPLNPWGSPHSAIGNWFLFTGRQWDEESGLYCYRARFYDSLKGRFLERDPLWGKDDFNLYAYVDDRPTHFVDPLGAAKCPANCDWPWAWQRLTMDLDVLGQVLDSFQAIQDIATLGGTVVVRKVGDKVVKEVSKEAVKKLIKEKIKEYVKDKLKGVITDAIKELLDDPLNPEKACRALAECEASRGVFGKSTYENAVGNEIRKCEWGPGGYAWKVYGLRYTLPRWAGGWDW